MGMPVTDQHRVDPSRMRSKRGTSRTWVDKPEVIVLDQVTAARSIAGQRHSLRGVRRIKPDCSYDGVRGVYGYPASILYGRIQRGRCKLVTYRRYVNQANQYRLKRS
jgi:hypothetical protein